MLNQQLLDYIKRQLTQGVAKETINANLLSQGWQQGDIDEGFLAVGNNIVSTNKIQINPTLKSNKKTIILAGLMMFAILCLGIGGYLIFSKVKSIVNINSTGIKSSSDLVRKYSMFGTFYGGFEGISVTPDNKKIIFTYFQDKKSYIYISNIDGTSVNLLLGPSKDSIYENPMVSPDGSMIAFVERFQTDKSNLYTINLDGTGIKQITHGDAGTENILNFAFLTYDTIYFKNSPKAYNSSPIASSQPHKIDIYSLNINKNELKRITNLQKYNWPGDIVINPDSLEIYAFPYLIDLKTLKVSDISISGNSFPQISSNKKFMVFAKDFIEGYGGLYLFDMNNKTTHEIIRQDETSFNSPKLINNSTEIIFISDKALSGPPGKVELWTMDLNGTNLKKVNMQIPL